MKELDMREIDVDSLRFFFETLLMYDPVASDHLLVEAYANYATDKKLYKYQLDKFFDDKGINCDFFVTYDHLLHIHRQEQEHKFKQQRESAQNAVTEGKQKTVEEGINADSQTISHPLVAKPLSKEWLTQEPPPFEFCVNPIIPCETVTLLRGCSHEIVAQR